MRILVLGVNGFIGSHLARRVLEKTDWEVSGMDLAADKLGDLLDHPRLRYVEGDVGINREWIEYHVKKCDVCLPLVAIATPAAYLEDPLAVFHLDFEENLRVVRQCLRHDTRVVFPSTSEVYGMCPDERFREYDSPLVLGPIQRERWIYACAKQLLDRVIWALGRQRGLRFTLFRPFNWIGPGLDSIDTPKEGSSRVVTQFLGHILRGEAIHLVDGGHQRRSFTWIGDGIDALLRILRNEGGRADGRIFNLGNPTNDSSIRELAGRMVEIVGEWPALEDRARRVELRETPAEEYYGPAYQDMTRRVPDVAEAEARLGWRAEVDLDEALRRTIAYYVERLDSEATRDLE